MIDIADDDAGRMRRCKGNRGIGRHPHKEAPVAVRQMTRPVAGRVDLVNIIRLGRPGHDEPFDAPVLAAQQGAWPGGMDRKRPGACAYHRFKLGGRLILQGLAVDLGDLFRISSLLKN